MVVRFWARAKFLPSYKVIETLHESHPAYTIQWDPVALSEALTGVGGNVVGALRTL